MIDPLLHDSLITQSIPMEPKHSIIKGLHCIDIAKVWFSFIGLTITVPSKSEFFHQKC